MTLAELRQLFSSGQLSKPDYITRMLEGHLRLFQYPELLRESRVASIRITGEEVQFQLREPACWMTCPVGEARVAPIEILNFGAYEPDETAALVPLLRGTRTILDIGANIGWFSLWFAQECPDAQIHAFEPLPRSMDFLHRNLELNDMGHRIARHALALSDRAGDCELFVYPAGMTNVSMANVSGATDATRILARMGRLDDWTTENGVVPDFIKCDVEGAELLVFRGAEDTLKRHRPIVFTEMLRKWTRPFGYHPNDVIGFFSGLSYDCYAVGRGGLVRFASMSDDSVETNFVFMPRERQVGVSRP